MSLFKILSVVIILWLFKKSYLFYKGIKISIKDKSNIIKHKNSNIQEGEFEDIE